jgi:L-alanine-DL-glutamate epimerase-like enolase superfamily enzyme
MLVESLAPILLHAGSISVVDVRTLLDAQVQGWNMSKAAIEAAVLDALLRRVDLSLVEFLEGARSLVPAGAAVGMPKGKTTDERLDEFGREVHRRFSEGYKRVRIKAAPTYRGDEWTTQPIAMLRRGGVDGILQPDGNMAYNESHVALLSSLLQHGVGTIEQPFGRRNLQLHRELRRKAGLNVIADESIESIEDVVLALDDDQPSFDGVCNKWSRVGGILESARIIDTCVARGAKVFMGGMIGIGTHVDLALASMIPDEFDIIGDHGPSGKWIAQEADPTPVISWANAGYVQVSDRPGVVDIDRDVVMKWLTADVMTVGRENSPKALWPLV